MTPARSSSKEAPRGARGTVLVVEDDSGIARGYTRLLERSGFEVTCCQSLAGAQASLASNPGFTIALIDLGLPDGSGLALVEEICTDHPKTAPVVVTGQLDAAASLECWSRGVLALNKPFDPEQLEALIDGVVARHDQWSERVGAFARAHSLSRQEQGVVRCAVHGLDLEETAKALGCAALTVGTYWRRVFEKTGLRSKLAVVAAVARRPIAPPARGSGTRRIRQDS